MSELKRFSMTMLWAMVIASPWILIVRLTFPNPAPSRWYGAVAGGVGAILGMIGGELYKRRHPRLTTS